MPAPARIGERRSYDGALCTVRYIGEVAGTAGQWLGVEWDEPSRGKHDGQHNGVRYFTCRSKSPTAASFVRPTRPADVPQTFLSALHHKYAGDPAQDAQNPPRQVVFSGKVAEEVGFEKVRRKQARLDELQFVILDGAQIAHAHAPSPSGTGDRHGTDGGRSIGQVCPRVRELDLSRNLFERFGPVVDICAELPSLRSLRVNGNRFQQVLDDQTLASAHGVFDGVTELALEDTLLEWREICHVAARFPALHALHAGSNQLSALTPAPPAAPFTSALTSLHLEFNEFSSLADLAPLAAVPSLRNLLLKGNRISAIVPPTPSGTPLAAVPVFGPNLHYVDISYNQVASWSFVDALPDSFPGLTSLRLTHNPIYDDPDLDDGGGGRRPDADASSSTTTAIGTTTTATITPGSSSSSSQAHARGGGLSKTDEAYMLVVARLPALRTLNFSTISPADRADAEMFYLSRVARRFFASAAVANAANAGSESEDALLARLARHHRRWAELCAKHGEPAILARRRAGDGAARAGAGDGAGGMGAGFLEGRLVRVEFVCSEPPAISATAPAQTPSGAGDAGNAGDGGQEEGGGGDGGKVKRESVVQIPKSYDIYAVKGVAGRLFGLPPLALRLVWETGEWDPVGGFDEAGDESEEEEEDLEAEWVRREEDGTGLDEEGGQAPAVASKRARWVKREVELRDGPRQFGYCVDGSDVRIRVERR